MSDNTDTSSTDDDAPVTMGAIRQIVKEMVGGASSKVNEDTETRQAGRRALSARLDRDSELESRVEAAVKQIKEQEDRERERKGLLDEVAALKEKVADKPPVERNWAHKLMGWGEDK